MSTLCYISYDVSRDLFPEDACHQAIALLVSRLGPLTLMHGKSWNFDIRQAQVRATTTLPVTLFPYKNGDFASLHAQATKVILTSDGFRLVPVRLVPVRYVLRVNTVDPVCFLRCDDAGPLAEMLDRARQSLRKAMQQ